MKKNLFVFALFLCLFSCKKSEIVPEEDFKAYFMSAQINNLEWTADSGSAMGMISYIHPNHYCLSIITQKANPLSNGVRYQISFSNFKPLKKGLFYFNNVGNELRIEDGIGGSVHGWKKNGEHEYFNATAIQGFMNITGVTRDEIEGSFEFTAVWQNPDITSIKDTIRITKGTFFVPIYVDPSLDWPGPQFGASMQR